MPEYGLLRLVYVSNALSNITKQDLYAIEKSSTINNQDAEITGILTFKENTFIQFLEGPELNLKRTFEKIKKDARHCNIDILRMSHIQQRQFKNWHMKYIPIESVELQNDILHEKLFKHGNQNSHSLDLAIESRAIILAFKQANYYPQKFHD